MPGPNYETHSNGETPTLRLKGQSLSIIQTDSKITNSALFPKNDILRDFVSNQLETGRTCIEVHTAVAANPSIFTAAKVGGMNLAFVKLLAASMPGAQNNMNSVTYRNYRLDVSTKLHQVNNVWVHTINISPIEEA